jgi:hypothetical protein
MLITFCTACHDKSRGDPARQVRLGIKRKVTAKTKNDFSSTIPAQTVS